MKNEQTEAHPADVEYSEVFIGDGTDGACCRSATVRVYEDFVLCALHHRLYEITEELNDANLALELVAPWHSVAKAGGTRRTPSGPGQGPTVGSGPFLL